MRHMIITITFLILSNDYALAHKCILGSNSVKDIMVYNTCKNDMATGLAEHDQSIKTDRIAELERENEKLKTKIFIFKQNLLELMKHID